MRRFPDVVARLADLARAYPGVTGAGTTTPPDLAGRLPWIRFARVGGGSSLVEDRPVVAVDVFAGDVQTAGDLAEAWRQYLCASPPPDPLLDAIECDTGPAEQPWGDPDVVRRFVAVYRVVTRCRDIPAP